MIAQHANRGPIRTVRYGRLDISLWRQRNDRGFCGETSDPIRVCVRHSRLNRRTNEWKNQAIWCDPEDLRDLANAIDQLNNEPSQKR